MDTNPLEVVRLLRERGWVAVPRLSDTKATKIHVAFDDVITYAGDNPEWVDRFNQKSSAWKNEARVAGMLNSGYFGPYYRDVRGMGKDNKVTYQTCNAFHASCQKDPDVENILPQPVECLDSALSEALVEGLSSFSKVADSIATVMPHLKDVLVLENKEPNVSIRVLKYFFDGRVSTNPHVDKSALTYIMHTSDGAEGGSLTFASPSNKELTVADFRNPNDFGAPLSSFGHVLIGEAFNAAGLTSLKATPHAALKPSSGEVRYSIIAFWLLRGVDLAPFNTKVNVVDDNSILRDY